MSQDRPSPLPSRYSIVSSRAGSLPACLNVTDDSEPSVWFSLEGLSLRTKVAHDETALFLSKTTFSPDGMLGSTAAVPQLAGLGVLGACHARGRPRNRFQQPAESSGGRGSSRWERWYDCESLAGLTGGPLQTLRTNGRTLRGPLLKSRAKGVFRGGRMPCACCARARPRPSNRPSLPGHRRPGRARSG